MIFSSTKKVVSRERHFASKQAGEGSLLRRGGGGSMRGTRWVDKLGL